MGFPGFPVELVGVGDLHAASLMKAAHANLFGATCRKSGSPFFFVPCTLGRTWGTRPLP
jgi:hypothetical protein